MSDILSKEEKISLFQEAKAFYDLAECGRINIPEQKNIATYIPYIVNMSFCTELYLKLLLAENGMSVDELRGIGHNLLELYNKLEQHKKETIYQSFKKPMVYSIPDELERSKLAFPEWRYLVLNKANNRQKNPNAPQPPRKPSFSDVRSGKCTGDFEYKSSMQFSPYFFKELNEILGAMCKTYINN